MSVQPNVPAIAMEEVLPLAVSSALAQASHLPCIHADERSTWIT